VYQAEDLRFKRRRLLKCLPDSLWRWSGFQLITRPEEPSRSYTASITKATRAINAREVRIWEVEAGFVRVVHSEIGEERCTVERHRIRNDKSATRGHGRNAFPWRAARRHSLSLLGCKSFVSGSANGNRMR
jgi:hypothetical protein